MKKIYCLKASVVHVACIASRVLRCAILTVSEAECVSTLIFLVYLVTQFILQSGQTKQSLGLPCLLVLGASRT